MNPSQVAEVVSKLKAKNINLIQVIQEKDNLIIMLNKKIAELNNLIQDKLSFLKITNNSLSKIFRN